MAAREIPEPEMHALALLNMQASMVGAAFRLFTSVASAAHLQRLAPREDQTHAAHIALMRGNLHLELQKLVAAKALTVEAHGATNIARRMAAKFPAHAEAIKTLQAQLDKEFPELVAVRNSFAHLDERAAFSVEIPQQNGANDRLFGLNANLLSVRGATGDLVEITLSENLPVAIFRLLDGIIEIFPKKADHDDAMDDLSASPAGPWLREDF